MIKCVPLRWLYKVRRIKGRNKFLPSSVDGVVGDDEIAQLFSDKYNHLYTSVSYDVDEMNSIKKYLVKILLRYMPITLNNYSSIVTKYFYFVTCQPCS